MMPFPLALSLDLFGLLRLRRWSCPSGIGRDAGAESTAFGRLFFISCCETGTEH
jgi:hypothetical protein